MNAHDFRRRVEVRIIAMREAEQSERGVTLSKLGEGGDGRGGDNGCPSVRLRMAERQASIARLRRLGLATKEIAVQLGLTERQVRHATNTTDQLETT